jgi:hypothetical protein
MEKPQRDGVIEADVVEVSAPPAEDEHLAKRKKDLSFILNSRNLSVQERLKSLTNAYLRDDVTPGTWRSELGKLVLDPRARWQIDKAVSDAHAARHPLLSDTEEAVEAAQDRRDGWFNN